MQIGNKAPLFMHSHLYGVGTYRGEASESLLGKTSGKVVTNPIYTETVISERYFELVRK